MMKTQEQTMIRKESFEPIYTDLHIHTLKNPDLVKDDVDYDLFELTSRINNYAGNYKKLISFTDHNVINKKVYLSTFPEDYFLIVGVELHVSYSKTKKPYHCHMFFNTKICSSILDDINTTLDILYPKKTIDKHDYKEVPNLETIINHFSKYDFILLPHGGQNHSTFNDAIPKGARFDDIMEKVLFYNQFDGFTSRSTSKRMETQKYFKELGIDEFTNLITCSDNYEPNKYPNPKSDDAEAFVPTWIFSEPTFDGLRLALSESNRLVYSKTAPKRYEEYIRSFQIKNDLLDIDVSFKQGLNVIIGESSSGKSLLVDTLAKRINPDLGINSYAKNYSFDTLTIVNPAGFSPYYINQNYISEIANNNKIEDIPIIKQMFGPTNETTKKTNFHLEKLDSILTDLFNSVEEIENYQRNLRAIQTLDNLVVLTNKIGNPLEKMLPPERIADKLDYDENTYNNHNGFLDEILDFSRKNVFVEDISSDIKRIKDILSKAYEISQFESYVRQIIYDNMNIYDKMFKYSDEEVRTKNEQFDRMLVNLAKYLEERDRFDKKITELIDFNYSIKSKPIKVAGHELFIENNLQITKEIIISTINDFLRMDSKINDINKLEPKDLFLSNVNGQYSSIQNYDDFKRRISEKIKANNKYTYKIVTADKRKWEELSPGWKTAILTELILQYDKDQAPLIIDQPEDNLANKYINDKLIKDLKKAKIKKQIIIVSHNATIPILADAENIVYCWADGSRITIRSNYLRI